MPERIADRAEQAIRERVFPGCVIGIVRADGTRDVLPFGHFTYEPSSPEVQEGTIYDLASITKSIPVASLALTLAGEARFNLADIVTKYVPELQHDFGATIEDLLTYRVRGPRLSHLQHQSFEEVRTHILESGFDAPPAESVYTNLPAFILGLVLERVTGEILPALSQRYFFGPLRMSDSTFFPHDLGRIPPTEIVHGHEIRGVVHDESARIFANARRAVGHAGLFSTAPDLLNFLEGALAGDMPHVLVGAQKGWGWQKAEPWFMGVHCSEASFGKTGFTGTSVAVDPVKGIGLVILSNRTYPTRPADATSYHSAINQFRANITDIVHAY